MYAGIKSKIGSLSKYTELTSTTAIPNELVKVVKKILWKKKKKSDLWKIFIVVLALRVQRINRTDTYSDAFSIIVNTF